MITNNPRVYGEYKGRFPVEYHEGAGPEEILRMARDAIHLGAKLLLHPMMGRIRPNETPYKSVLLDLDAQKTSFLSVQIIEDSIAQTDKLLNHAQQKTYSDSILADLQYLDLQLLASGLAELR